MVDARTGTAHFLTIDAAAEGLPRGQYVAICGEEVLPRGAGRPRGPLLPAVRAAPRPEIGGPAVSGPARWVLSPLDGQAHLLVAVGDHPWDVLKARCGHLMPVGPSQHEQPPGVSTCPTCAVIAEVPPPRFPHTIPAGHRLRPNRLYVRFESDDQLITLRPHLLRVLTVEAELALLSAEHIVERLRALLLPEISAGSARSSPAGPAGPTTGASNKHMMTPRC
jgi:hypothetical protein